MPLVQSNQVNGFWIGGQKSGSGWKWTDGSQGKVYLVLTHFIQELLNVSIISNILKTLQLHILIGLVVNLTTWVVIKTALR